MMMLAEAVAEDEVGARLHSEAEKVQQTASEQQPAEETDQNGKKGAPESQTEHSEPPLI
jgi:hypothetical protein